MVSRRGRLFVVSGPSGVGKSTIVERVLSRVEGMAFSVSHTTRTPRAGETEGRDYHYVSRKEFERLVSSGEFLEWAEVHGQLYGTARTVVESETTHGRDVVLDIDVQGAESVKRAVADAVLILVVPASREVLEGRLRLRATESPEQVERRLGVARRELGCYDLYEYVVVNDELEAACRAFEAIVLAERQKAHLHRALLEELSGSDDERA